MLLISLICHTHIVCYSQYKLNPRHGNVYYNVISLIVYYWLLPTTMDAVLATIVAGRWAIISKYERSKKILISTLIYWFYQNPLTLALKQTWARSPTPQTVWIHWIHATGGVSGSITMVVVFVGCLCCCGWTRDVTSSSYVKRYERITLR